MFNNTKSGNSVFGFTTEKPGAKNNAKSDFEIQAALNAAPPGMHQTNSPFAQQQMPFAQQQMPFAQQQMPFAQQQMPFAQQQLGRKQQYFNLKPPSHNNTQNSRNLAMDIKPIPTQNEPLQHLNEVNKVNRQVATHGNQTIRYNPMMGLTPDNLRNMPIEYVNETYTYLQNKWNMQTNMGLMVSSHNQLEKNSQLMFNFVDDMNNIDYEQAQKRYNDCQKELMDFLQKVHHIPPGRLSTNILATLEIAIPKMMMICEAAFQNLMCLVRINEYGSPNTQLPPNWKNLLKQNFDMSKVNNKQKLLLRLYKYLSQDKFKKFGNECWEEITTKEGFMTQAYKKVCDVKQYIIQKCNRFLEPENWSIITSVNSKNMIQDLENTLVDVTDLDFQGIELDRHKFSFNNGIFVTNIPGEIKYNEKTGDPRPTYYTQFFPYYPQEEGQQTAALLDSSRASAKYFEQDFLEYPADMDWYKIPTPSLHSILEYQFRDREDADEIYRTIYALIGRMLFARNEIDNWQIVVYIQGVGGSGKSTIATHCLQNFYHAPQIATIDNKIEMQFGLGPLIERDPFITIGDELDEKCQLDLTQFLKMVSGEVIGCAVKGKKPIYKSWPSHLWFQGNQLPPWRDKGGALSRRVVSIFFHKSVRAIDKDMKLDMKLKNEIPNIIQKCSKAYLELANEFGDKEFWSFCPKYFQEARQELQRVTNIVRSFMESEEVIYDKSGVVLESEFVARLKKYADDQGLRINSSSMKNKEFTISSVIQQINDTSDDINITYEKKTVTINNKRYNNAKVLLGIRLKQEEDINPELYEEDSPKELFTMQRKLEGDLEIEHSDEENDDDDTQDQPGDRPNVDIEYAPE
jgi:hypothetical protein